AQRQREIGIRMALGARPDQIRKQFLRLGFRLVAMGLPLGCAGAWIVARTMADFLYGVGPANLVVLGSAALALGGVAMVACLVPSLRAAHVAPAEALHTD
ncbi:MAG: FtsX-like permease family protein, partial [Opitutaceae bacterium]